MVQVKKMGRAVNVEVLDSSKHLKFMVFSIESDAIWQIETIQQIIVLANPNIDLKFNLSQLP